MEVKLLLYPTEADWMFCKECCLETVGKIALSPPDADWKHRILKARHSPIRVLHFAFRLEVPYWVSVHLCRHVHAQPYVRTQRNDRQKKYDRGKAPQDTPVKMIWYMNAEEFMTVANKRLCRQASPETTAVVKEMCRLVEEQLPEFCGLLVPACVHNGKCNEMFPCGNNLKGETNG